MNQGGYGYGAQGQNYSIDQALALMRSVPAEGLNERLVVQVIRKTLESAGISIPQVLGAVVQRQDEVTNEIVRIQTEIASLHQQIEIKTAQVQNYQDQLAEIDQLRERFED
jgi:DNA repair ATPase RecN